MNDLKLHDAPCKTIALVSGKGGSGKTMIASTMTTILDSLGYRTLLVDGDLGTAGLTYYMGLNTVSNISVGLTNLTQEEYHYDFSMIERVVQDMNDFEHSKFLGVGDHRRYLKNGGDFYESSSLSVTFKNLIEYGSNLYDFIIVDCRGGIDRESLAVCSAVDDILIVAETDTTSFQATQYLVDTLYDNELSSKLSGFFVNKVFDDPSTIARSGTASFKSQYLSSVPFDLDATKSFLVGELPNINSIFATQIWHGLFKLYPSLIRSPSRRQLSFNDFRGLSLRDDDSLIGGMILSFSSLMLGFYLFYTNQLGYSPFKEFDTVIILMLMLLATFSGMEPTRKAMGRVFSLYKRLIVRVFSGK